MNANKMVVAGKKPPHTNPTFKIKEHHKINAVYYQEKKC